MQNNYDKKVIEYDSLLSVSFNHSVSYSNENNFDSVVQNLCQNNENAAVVNKNIAQLLACFLFVIENYKVPLLLLGPHSEHLIKSFTYGAFNKGYSELTFGNQFNGIEFKQALDNCGQFVLINNIFSSSFSENSLYLAHCCEGKNIFWQYPFYEDLQVQPKSLFHFAYPFITELFVEVIPYATSLSFGTQRLEFDMYQAYSIYSDKFELPDFQELGLSKLQISTIKSIVNETHDLHVELEKAGICTHMTNIQRATNIELLFGLIPFCICLGKQALLNKYLDDDNVLPEIKANLKLFCS